MKFNGKILLVDDEAHIRKFVGLLLRSLGSPVVIEAANGAEAVRLYEHELPDLVLLDINMPVQDGVETLKQLRELDPDCLVVMLTSLVNRRTVEECVRLGAVGYLRKDTPREEITSRLQQIIDECLTVDPQSP